MILILNCMIKENFSRSFDRAILHALENSGSECRFFHQPDFAGLSDTSSFTHLIISGSEASVLESNPWEDRLADILKQFVDNGKKVLGICYGHQFMAYTLAGKQYVRRALTPEFGWAHIALQTNPLFTHVKNLVSMVSHNDEVIDLPGDFKIIAATPRCKIHAFQYQNRPVWGVQFHPEYRQEEAEEIFTEFSKENPGMKSYFINELESAGQLEQNKLIISDFCLS